MLRVFGNAFRWTLVALATVLVVWAFLDVGVRSLGGLGDDRIRLRILYWGDNREREIIDDLIAAFEAEHPDIEVIGLHATDYDTKLKTMLAAGDPPDAFYMPYERMLGQLAIDGLLEPLDKYIEHEAVEDPGWFEQFYPELWPAFRWNDEQQRLGDGTLYGVPKGYTPLGCYVNTDLFEAAGVPVPYDGWTWAEYEDAAKKITALSPPDDPNEQIWGAVVQTWPLVVRAHLWSNEGDFFGDGFDDVALDEPEVQDALDLWIRGRAEGWIYRATGIALADDELFRLGRIGISGPLGRWKTPTYRKVDFGWDYVPLPTKEPGANAATPLVTVGWSIASTSAYPDETWDLVKFLCGAPGQTLIAELGLEIPSLRTVAETEAFHGPGQLPANSQLFLDQVRETRVIQMPLEPEFRRFVEEDIQSKALTLFSMTSEEGAASVEERWAALRASPLNNPDLPRMPWALLATGATAVVLVAIGGLVIWSRKQKLGLLDRTEERTGWMFVGLWILGFVLFTLGPMIASFLLSLSTWTATGPISTAEFVGLGNYTEMVAQDRSFYQSIWVTVKYTLLAVPIMQVASIAVALLMNLSAKGIGIFRTVYFVPSVVSGVALVTLWITIFDNNSGLLNASVDGVLGVFGLQTPEWLVPDWFGLDAPWAASPALVIMGLWAVGGGMVIYLAALKNVPKSLYEAAHLDGASPWRRFLSVTLPMISPIVFFQVVMAIIASFQIFTQAFVIRGSTGGQNESLLFYVLNLYDQAFRFHNMGYASAMAWVLFIAILLLTLLVFRGSRGVVHYEGLK
ncbi:MAG: extracellular solute-binding protein [Planctomycetota bacterium]